MTVDRGYCSAAAGVGSVALRALGVAAAELLVELRGGESPPKKEPATT
jgi:hypothetical protein